MWIRYGICIPLVIESESEYKREIIAKHRKGPTGTVDMKFWKEIGGRTEVERFPLINQHSCMLYKRSAHFSLGEMGTSFNTITICLA